MIMNDKTYNALKWIAQFLLPGLGTLYFALSGIWGLPYGEQIIGTITAVDTFLGLILGLSSNLYKNSDAVGKLLIDTSNPGRDIYRLDVGSIEDWAERKTITLRVEKGVALAELD